MHRGPIIRRDKKGVNSARNEETKLRFEVLLVLSGIYISNMWNDKGI